MSWACRALHPQPFGVGGGRRQVSSVAALAVESGNRDFVLVSDVATGVKMTLQSSARARWASFEIALIHELEGDVYGGFRSSYTLSHVVKDAPQASSATSTLSSAKLGHCSLRAFPPMERSRGIISLAAQDAGENAAQQSQ